MGVHAIPRYDLFDVDDDEYKKDKECYNTLVRKLKTTRENTLMAWISKYVNTGDHHLALEYYEPNGCKKYACNGRVINVLNDLQVIIVWNEEKKDGENVCRDDIVFSSEIHTLGYYGDDASGRAFDILNDNKDNGGIKGLILRVDGLVKADTDELRICLQEDGYYDAMKELEELKNTLERKQNRKYVEWFRKVVANDEAEGRLSEAVDTYVLNFGSYDRLGIYKDIDYFLYVVTPDWENGVMNVSLTKDMDNEGEYNDLDGLWSFASQFHSNAKGTVEIWQR